VKDAGYKLISEKQLALKTSFAAGQCSLVDGRSMYQCLYKKHLLAPKLLIPGSRMF